MSTQAIAALILVLGVVSPEERNRLMARARATLARSTFLDPFRGAQIESMLSGVPVISVDWGVFAEYNVDGVTCCRCRTFELFVWAAAPLTSAQARRAFRVARR